MKSQLRVHRGGSGDPQLLLLHGLGATGDVWNGWHSVLAHTWPGRWVAPDLPGHGGSPPLPGYTSKVSPRRLLSAWTGPARLSC